MAACRRSEPPDCRPARVQYKNKTPVLKIICACLPPWGCARVLHPIGMYRAWRLLPATRRRRLCARPWTTGSSRLSAASRRALHALDRLCRHLHLLVHLHPVLQHVLTHRTVTVTLHHGLQMDLEVLLILVEFVHGEIYALHHHLVLEFSRYRKLGFYVLEHLRRHPRTK